MAVSHYKHWGHVWQLCKMYMIRRGQNVPCSGGMIVATGQDVIQKHECCCLHSWHPHSNPHYMYPHFSLGAFRLIPARFMQAYYVCIAKELLRRRVLTLTGTRSRQDYSSCINANFTEYILRSTCCPASLKLNQNPSVLSFLSLFGSLL